METTIFKNQMVSIYAVPKSIANDTSIDLDIITKDEGYPSAYMPVEEVVLFFLDACPKHFKTHTDKFLEYIYNGERFSKELYENPFFSNFDIETYEVYMRFHFQNIKIELVKMEQAMVCLVDEECQLNNWRYNPLLDVFVNLNEKDVTENIANSVKSSVFDDNSKNSMTKNSDINISWSNFSFIIFKNYLTSWNL